MRITLVRRTAKPELRLLAQEIALTQQAQIGQVQGYLIAWGRSLAAAPVLRWRA